MRRMRLCFSSYVRALAKACRHSAVFWELVLPFLPEMGPKSRRAAGPTTNPSGGASS